MVNTAHREIDLARPRSNRKTTGFLPKERAWLDQVVEAGMHSHAPAWERDEGVSASPEAVNPLF